MNRAGSDRQPFLFGIDFECTEGFFHPVVPGTPLPLRFCTPRHRPAPEHCLPDSRQRPVPSPELRILHTDLQQYRRQFAIAEEGLHYGNSFLLNLTGRTRVATNLSLEEVFERSRSPYKLLWPGRFVCFSPEPFVRISPGGTVSTYPMKGTADATRPGADRDLMDDYKEQCEHRTIVDLMRNDLNRIARQVRVRRFRYLEAVETTRGRIWQTSSEITGELGPDWTGRSGDLIRELLPAGSVSGAPKESTVRLIREAEGIPRGFYTGVFGFFDGYCLDSAVLIRFLEQGPDGLYFRSGGGITVNSRADAEYAELLEKIYLPIPDATE